MADSFPPTCAVLVALANDRKGAWNEPAFAGGVRVAGRCVFGGGGERMNRNA
jgi:hypothetical protein